jgi:hypothetical protein
MKRNWLNRRKLSRVLVVSHGGHVSNCTREFGLVDSGKSMLDEDNQDFQVGEHHSRIWF